MPSLRLTIIVHRSHDAFHMHEMAVGESESERYVLTKFGFDSADDIDVMGAHRLQGLSCI